MLFCYNLITFDSAAHLKWTNPTEKMELTHLWNETLELQTAILRNQHHLGSVIIRSEGEANKKERKKRCFFQLSKGKEIV